MVSTSFCKHGLIRWTWWVLHFVNLWRAITHKRSPVSILKQCSASEFDLLNGIPDEKIKTHCWWQVTVKFLQLCMICQKYIVTVHVFATKQHLVRVVAEHWICHNAQHLQWPHEMRLLTCFNWTAWSSKKAWQIIKKNLNLFDVAQQTFETS